MKKMPFPNLCLFYQEYLRNYTIHFYKKFKMNKIIKIKELYSELYMKMYECYYTYNKYVLTPIKKPAKFTTYLYKAFTIHCKKIILNNSLGTKTFTFSYFKDIYYSDGRFKNVEIIKFIRDCLVNESDKKVNIYLYYLFTKNITVIHIAKKFNCSKQYIHKVINECNYLIRRYYIEILES